MILRMIGVLWLIYFSYQLGRWCVFSFRDEYEKADDALMKVVIVLIAGAAFFGALLILFAGGGE